MELDRNQPSGSGLREALAPWFDHSAAWLVLLCVVLTVFATITGIAVGGHDQEFVVKFSGAAVSLATMALRLAHVVIADSSPASRGLALARLPPWSRSSWRASQSRHCGR